MQRYVCWLFVVLPLIGCHQRQPTERFRAEMREASKATSRLFADAWAVDAFQDPRNESRILRSLDAMIEGFHGNESVGPGYSSDPGFRVALEANARVLSEIRGAFTQGSKDYARWRLRGLTASCVACHSRHRTSVDFVGSSPTPSGDDIAQRLAAAEFLVATRQFDRAARDLLQLAAAAGLERPIASDGLEALKLWLTVQVRVKHRRDESIEAIESLLVSEGVSDYNRRVLEQWAYDLRNAPSMRNDVTGYLDRARELLAEVLQATAVRDDERFLARTLQASSMLHELLEHDLPRAERRQASCLLSMSYQHLPVRSLDVLGELYLEQCIREFPATREAREAYAAFEDYTELVNSGSGGLHLETETLSKLRELRTIAFGDPP